MSKSLLADDREDYVFGALVKGVTKLAQAAGKNLGNKAEQAVIKNSKKYKTLIDELTTDNAEGAGVVYTKAELKDFEKGADGFYDLVLEVLQELRIHKSMHDLQANELIDSGVKPASVKRILSRDIEDEDLTEGERSIRNKFMTKYFPMDQDGMENMLFPSDRYFSVGAGPPSRKPILIEHAAGKEPKAIGGLMNQSKESKSKGGRMKSNSMKIKYDKGSEYSNMAYNQSDIGWDELAELERDVQKHESLLEDRPAHEWGYFLKDRSRIADKNSRTLLKDAEKRIEAWYEKDPDRKDAHISSIYSEAKKKIIKEAERKREAARQEMASGGSMLVPPEMEIEEQEMKIKYDKGSKVDKRRSAIGWDELVELERELQQNEIIVEAIYGPLREDESSFAKAWDRIADKNRRTLLKDAEKRIGAPYEKDPDRKDAHIRSIYSEAKKKTIKRSGEKRRKRELDLKPEEVPMSKSNSMKIKYDKGSKVDKRRSAKGWDELAELERDLQQHERIVEAIYEPQEREESSFVEDWNRIRDKNRMTLLKDAEKRIESPYSKYTDRIDAHIRSIYSEAKKNTIKEAGEKSRKRESDPEPEEVPISKSPPSGATYEYDLPRGVHKASGGSMLVPPEMEIEEQEMPVDTYPNIPPDEMAAAEASQLPDEQMEDKHLEYVLDEALDPEDQEYLMGVLETDERLSNIFDKVMDVAAEFSGEGEVDGPGTGVSDSVPARLSDGEFVFTKKATDQIGSDQLQTMMDDAERAYDGGYMKKAFGGLTLDPMDNEKSYGVEQMNETQNELRKQMLGANRMPSVLR